MNTTPRAKFPLPFSFGSHLLHDNVPDTSLETQVIGLEVGWRGMGWAGGAANTLSLTEGWRLNLKCTLLLCGSGPAIQLASEKLL